MCFLGNKNLRPSLTCRALPFVVSPNLHVKGKELRNSKLGALVHLNCRLMLNYSSFSLTYYHEERYSRTNNGEAEIRSYNYFPDKYSPILCHGMVCLQYHGRTLCNYGRLRFVHTMTKIDLDRRVQTRRGWAVEVGKFNINYIEGI